MATGQGFPEPVSAPPRSGENSPHPLGNEEKSSTRHGNGGRGGGKFLPVGENSPPRF